MKVLNDLRDFMPELLIIKVISIGVLVEMNDSIKEGEKSRTLLLEKYPNLLQTFEFGCGC